MKEWLQVIGGTALVFLVLLDVFATVIVPRPAHKKLRLGPLLAALLAPFWQKMAGSIGSARLRQDVRGMLAPFLLVVSLMAWLLLLSLGFGLILHGQPGAVRTADTGFAESVFQAAMALSTLGIIGADVDGGARPVVAIAGLAGFAVLTLVITFLLSVQAALHRRETLVLRLEARAGRPPVATKLLSAFVDDEESLCDFFGDWEAWTADVMQSHLAYPILCRFRSLDEDNEWVTCLATVLDAAALTVARQGRGRNRAARRGRFLIGTAERALAEFGTLLNTDPTRTRLKRRGGTARLHRRARRANSTATRRNASRRCVTATRDRFAHWPAD